MENKNIIQENYIKVMENSPKIYFLKNKDGKYYNSNEKMWYSDISLANYVQKKDLKFLEKSLEIQFPDCEIISITENEFMFHLSMLTTDCIFAGEYLLNMLKEMNYRLPTISQVNKNLYQKCKNAVESLMPFSQWHNDFIKEKEDATFDVTGNYSEYIYNMARVKVQKTEEVNKILRAYHLDPDSINGIANKIIKNKK